jgi:hypothetical protein
VTTRRIFMGSVQSLAILLRMARTYRELGLPPNRATSRARVAYAAILGLLHLAQTDPDAPQSAALADEAAAVFLPS